MHYRYSDIIENGCNTSEGKASWNGTPASSGWYEAPSDFSSQSAGYFSSDKKISIIATLHFDVIVRQVMALSLERIIWYYPCHMSAAAGIFLIFFHTPQRESPNSIQQNRIRRPQLRISSGGRNQRDCEYIPHRILLKLSADTLFAAIQRV